MSKVSVFGLGYVGVVCSACLSQRGHSVIGIDIDQDKVDIINNSCSPIVEKDVEEIIIESIKNGRLRATLNCKEAILDSDISLICVATPSKGNGSLDLTYISQVCREIGETLRDKDSYHLVVVRSTVFPGTIETTVIPILEEASGKRVCEGFGVAMNPEFLRESTAVYDFNNPPKTVVGALRDEDASTIMKLYEGLPGHEIKTSLKVAEMVKYADNAFHALKITFGNEIGAICKPLGIDSHAVMDIFCLDTKLNLSPYYLKPGYAFGGSCLPKDVRALTYEAGRLDVKTPVLNAIMESNRRQIERILDRVISVGKKKIGVLGFAFKAGTDDLRESPIVELIELLLGKGFDICIYDKSVELATLRGANKRYIEEKVPHISSLMVNTVEKVIEHASVVIIGNKAAEFKDVLSSMRSDQTVIDFVRISEKGDGMAHYDGIAW